MSQLNIHWKGRPHHHLPRIRVVSSPDGILSTRSLSHSAAQNIVPSPLGLALEKARLQEQAKMRRERRRICRSISKPPVGGQASQRAKQNFRFYRSNKCCSSLTNPLRQHSEITKATVSSTVIAGTDGLSNNTSLEPHLSQSVQSLHRMTSRSTNQPGVIATSGQEGYVPCKNTLETMNNCHIQRVPLRNCTYHPKLPVKKVYRRTKSNLPSRTSHGAFMHPNTIHNRLGKSHKADYGMGQSRKAISTSLSQTISNTSMSSFSQASKLPSRTPSQLKTLRQFSRELECHFVAQEAICNADLAKSSTLSSALSVHTIAEFLPYQAEFQAAGLAVTSAEQRQHNITRSIRVMKPSSANKNGVDNEPIASKPDANRVVADTTSARGVNSLPARATDINTASSRTTIIQFGEPPIPLPLIAPLAPRKPTTKTLPWLRRAETTPETTQLIATDYISANQERTMQTNSTCSTCATPIIEFIAESKQSPSRIKQRHPSPSTHKPLDIRTIDMEYYTVTTGMNSVKSKVIDFPDHYDYENPLDFEQIPSHVKNGPHSSSMLLADQAAHVPVFQPIGDPVKQLPKQLPKSQAQFMLNSPRVTTDSNFLRQKSTICEKDVLRGLQVAMAAACNERVDAGVSESTRYRLRRFLADLSTIEGLDVNPLVKTAIRTAKDRKKEYDRKTKAFEHPLSFNRQTEYVASIPRDRDRTMGFVAADEPGRQGLDIAEILRRRQARASESVKERAIAMGWRERSVSAGC